MATGNDITARNLGSTYAVSLRPKVSSARLCSSRLTGACYAAARLCGPGLLAGITFSDWVRLLCENDFAVAPRRWPRAAVISAFSIANSIVARVEGALFAAPVAESAVAPPLFIIGHWRSGTTYLHNLLSCDARLIAPSLYQVLFPHTFRSTQRLVSPVLSAFFGGRRQSDNAPFAFDYPHEDEFATCSLSLCSPYAAMAFPSRRLFYRRYLTMREASEGEICRWQAALRSFVCKFAGRTGRVPLLKSPPHTCRIRLLLELFPGARFLHIHRHPYAVFRSRRAELLGDRIGHSLQPRPVEDPEDEIVAVYREMHDVLFHERDLVPDGRYFEVAYKDLVTNPIGTLRGVYRELGLGDFERCAECVQNYINSIGAYENNHHPPVCDSTRRRLEKEWQQSFEEWGYKP